MKHLSDYEISQKPIKLVFFLSQCVTTFFFSFNPDAIWHDKNCWLPRHSLISQIPCWFKPCFSGSVWVSKRAYNSCHCWETSEERWITTAKIKCQITGISFMEQESLSFPSLHSSTAHAFLFVFFLILHEFIVVSSCFFCCYIKQFRCHAQSIFHWEIQ